MLHTIQARLQLRKSNQDLDTVINYLLYGLVHIRVPCNAFKDKGCLHGHQKGICDFAYFYDSAISARLSTLHLMVKENK